MKGIVYWILLWGQEQQPWLQRDWEENRAQLRQMMYRLGPDLMEFLWELQLADVLAQQPDRLSAKLEALAEVRRLYREVMERGECVSLKQLAVNGKDLIALGAKPGKQIGELLELLLKQVLLQPQKNDKEILLECARQFLG